MNKHTKIVLLVISTILSLTFILCTFWGYTRYVSLHFTNTQKLTETYSMLDQACETTKIILCFAVEPDKYEKIRPMINSILDQTVKVSKIVMVQRPQDKSQKIPDYITKVANVLPAGKDYGYGMPLIPVLLRENCGDAMIICLDVNVIYGKDFIESLVNFAKEHNNSCIVTSSDHYATIIKPNCYEQNLADIALTDPSWINKVKGGHNVFQCSGNYKSI